MEKQIFKEVKTRERSYLSDGDYYEEISVDKELEKLLRANPAYELESVVGGGNGVFLIILKLVPVN